MTLSGVGVCEDSLESRLLTGLLLKQIRRAVGNVPRADAKLFVPSVRHFD
jgi:hypothetical protein